MEFIEKYRPYVEFLYLLSGPLMFIGVIVAIIQLYVLRKESKVRFERETINSSMKILDSKLRAVYDACDELEKLESYHEVPDFEGGITGLHRAGITCSNECLSKFEDDENYDFKRGVTLILNELETLSQYVLSGIINEELCYKLEVTHFLSFVEDYKHFMAFNRKSEDDRLYENLVELYGLWSNKLAHDETMKEHHKMQQAIKNNKRPNSLKVIGE